MVGAVPFEPFVSLRINRHIDPLKQLVFLTLAVRYPT